MAQPFTLKFVADLGDFVAQVKSVSDGVGKAAQVIGEMGQAAAPVAAALNAVSTAAQENVEVIAGMAAATTEAASAQSAEAAELARLTELLGSETAARASLNAAITDNTVAGRAAAEGTASTARVMQDATASTRTYNEALNASAAAAMAEGQAETSAGARLNARLASLRRLAPEELAANRTRQASAEGLAAFTSKAQGLGSMLTTLGLVNPQLLRVGVGIQMVGQAAESLTPKILEAGGGMAGFGAAVGPILAIGAGLTVVLAGLAAAAHLVKEAITTAIPQQESETGFAILLGNVEKADERLAELDQTALKFHLDPEALRNASESLTRLSQGALGSGQSLNTVIEMAARTHQPLEAMGAILGRLYETIESGQPIARMGTQLVRLGLLSASDVNALNNLHKEGAKGPQVWAAAEAALNKYSGAAAARANTFQGAMRGISAAWNEILAAFGKPIVDALTPYMQKLSRFMASLVPYAVEAGQFIGVLIQSGDGLAVLGDILTGQFGKAMTLITGILARMSPVVSATCTVIGATVKSLFTDVELAIVGLANSAVQTLASIFDRALAATTKFVAGVLAAMGPLQALLGGNAFASGVAAAGGIAGTLAGTFTSETAKLTADAKKAADEVTAARKALDDTLKKSQPSPPNAGTQFKPVKPGAIVEPDGKTGKSGGGGGPKGREAEVDAGAEAEKSYRSSLDLTNEKLSLGEISQSQAQQQNIQTITSYIGGLQRLQAQVPPTSAKFKQLSVQIKDAQQLLAQQKV